MSREVAALRQGLWNAGFKPVPLLTGRKFTVQDSWQVTCKVVPPGPVSERYLNTGLLCDGLRAVDIDIDDQTKADAVLKLADDLGVNAPLRFRDNSPRVALLYRAAEGEPVKREILGPITGYDSAGKAVRDKVEVLGRGQQLHAFGMHPSGAGLCWEEGTPGEVGVSDLPVVTEDQIGSFLAAAGGIIGAEPEKAPTEAAARAKPYDPVALAVDVASALKIIPNNDRVSWDAWNRIGLATWAATEGSEEGREVFHEWSSKSGAYNPEVTDARWDHFEHSPPDKIGAASIFFEARAIDPTWKKPSGMPFTAVAPSVVEAKLDAPDAPRRLLMGDDMWSMLTETPPELVKGIIGVGTLTVVSGGMGAGKSAWVSSVTHAVLTGSTWFGRETQQGRVMILAGEGTRRTIHDFAANCLHHGQDFRAVQRQGFAVHNGALLLNTPAGIAAALERLGEFKAHFGAFPDVLVIDTARKNFRGSVSDDKDVGVFYEHVALILGLGISVVVVAHTGKTSPNAPASGAKGSSDWEQGADYVLQMTGKVRDGETTIFFEKVKTGQDGDTIQMGYVFPDVPGAGTTPVAVPKTGTGKSVQFTPVAAKLDTSVQDNAKHKIAQDAIEHILSTNPMRQFSGRQLSADTAHYLATKGHEGYTADAIRTTHLPKMLDTGHRAYCRVEGKGHWRHASLN